MLLGWPSASRAGKISVSLISEKMPLNLLGGFLHKICIAVLLLLVPHALSAQNQGVLSIGEKARVHLRNAIGPLSVLGAAAGAGIGQWRNGPYEWELGIEGYGRRYASSYGYVVIQNVAAFGLDSTLHIDPRYHPSGSAPFWDRMKYAVKQTAITHGDDGRPAFNWSAIGGHLAAAQIAEAWHPDRSSSIGGGFVRGGIGIGSNALSNVLREFWPDIRRKLRH
jgi:hypothetical protein